MKKEEWFQFQEYVAEALKPISPYARSTKGSGNSGELADVKNDYLLVECKDENKKSVYNEEYMQKIINECPLHSNRVPILCTRNKDNKMRVHLDLDEFFDMYIELINYREGK